MGIQTEGIPQLYFDQVTLIHKYLDLIQPPQPVVNKLTRRKLEKQDDFQEWLCSEWEQLDMYHQQNMFAAPIVITDPSLVFPLYGVTLLKHRRTTGKRHASHVMARIELAKHARYITRMLRVWIIMAAGYSMLSLLYSTMLYMVEMSGMPSLRLLDPNRYIIFDQIGHLNNGGQTT